MTRLQMVATMLLISLFIFPTRAPADSLIQKAPEKAALLTNPFAGQRRAEMAGAKLFFRECAACHGVNGTGSAKAPSLQQPKVNRTAPGTLFWIVRNGSLTRGMPSFAHLPEPQRWQIVTYIQSLTAR